LSDNSRARRLFHHRVVDGDGLGRSERLGIERDKSEIASGLGDGVADRLHTPGIDIAVFIEQD
jgi:hypothetical protein